MTAALRLPAVLGAALLAPSAALACGGLFCDTSQPVNQAAERILFGQEGATLHMHVRITYQGPPTEFGWLLPTPPDVEVELSSEQLFLDLDTGFAPRFVLQTEIDDGCGFDRAAGGNFDGGAPVAEDGGGGGVQVLSREPVGPFDVAVLQAETIEDLRGWLDGNGYQIPEQTDEKLAPYLDLGAAFVAVKLLPDRESGDISPLRLSFTSSRPAIPIVPTSVAAEPDMGIIVHILGPHRAIPLNYKHVLINEAAIDWTGGGQNYADVVSQAADEADGKAFATDYAGLGGVGFRLYTAAELDAVRGAETGMDLVEALGLWDAFFAPLDADLQRVLPSGLILPADLSLQDYLGCPDCYADREGEIEVDGAALAERIEEEINAPREHLVALFGANPYLTRLYSTLSPAEMDLDPEFEFNADLGEVPNRRVAIQRVGCGPDGEPDFERATIETPSGIRFGLVDGANPNVIRRQAGETVRGADVPGARVIERALEAGQSEVEVDRTEEIQEMVPLGGDGADSGCACDAGDAPAPTTLALLGLLGLLGLRRRR